MKKKEMVKNRQTSRQVLGFGFQAAAVLRKQKQTKKKKLWKNREKTTHKKKYIRKKGQRVDTEISIHQDESEIMSVCEIL